MFSHADPGGGDTGQEHCIDGLMVRTHGAGDGAWVLLSAGLGGAGSYWSPQIAALTGPYRVAVYDHRGTAQSDRSPLPEDYTVGNMADDMRIVLDGLGIAAAHVVGHAAGALACLELAATRPGRVASATIVNGWCTADPHFSRCLDIRRAIYRAGGAEAYLRAQPLFLFPAEWISDNLALLDAQAAAHAAAFQSGPALLARMAAVEAFDGTALLAAVDCPVLVITAEDDMLVPARASRQLAAGLRNATLAQMPRGGHAINVTLPDAFNRTLLSFLAKQV